MSGQPVSGKPVDEDLDPSRERDEAESDEDEAGALDDVDVRNLLRKALDPPPDKRPAKRTLAAVQRQIRARSRGRFYADGWSTSRGPRIGYLVTALIVLVLSALTWLLLSPMGLG